jgi:large subunit ribosomal protein L1
MERILEAVKKAKENSRQRKFIQSWDFCIGLKNIDLKKPENRFSADVPLPEGTGRDIKVALFADTTSEEAKKKVDRLITKAEIESMAGNKKSIKKLADQYDWFFGEITLMTLIGKTLGLVLGPKGKMPKPIPPKASIESIVARARKSVMVGLKSSPCIQVTVGTEKLTDEQVAKNIMAVYSVVKEKLPKGLHSIKSLHIKTTMGKPVKFQV